jgi:hypothetical protein
MIVAVSKDEITADVTPVTLNGCDHTTFRDSRPRPLGRALSRRRLGRA